MKLEPPPDLGNMTAAADFWHTSMNEVEAWEAVRVACVEEAEKRRAAN
jgi:hypothetical protein